MLPYLMIELGSAHRISAVALEKMMGMLIDGNAIIVGLFASFSMIDIAARWAARKVVLFCFMSHQSKSVETV